MTILIFGLVLAPYTLTAQETAQQGQELSGEVITLDDCIQLAIEKNYGIESKRESLTRSAASRLGAWSQLMPSASMRFSWSHSGDDRYNFTETGYTVSDDHYSLGLSASQPLFAGGDNILSLKSSILNYESAQTDLDRERADLVYQTKQAFYSVISARQTEANTAQAVERTGDQWEFVAQRDTLGLADPTEVSQMKVTLAETELTFLQSKNARKQAEENLLAMLSLPLEANIELAEPKALIVEAAPLSDHLAAALEKNPQIIAVEIAEKSSNLNKWSSWSRYLPSVNASYSYNWSDNAMPASFTTIGDEATWSAGISASWTLFSGTSRISSLKSAHSDERQAYISMQQAKQMVESTVRSAYRRMEEAASRINLSDYRVQNAVLNATLFREKYELGDCTLLDVLQAELSLRQAENEKVSAVFDYRMSLAELELWSGIKTE